MDEQEARAQPRSFVAELRGLSYDELLERCGGGLTRDFVTPSGAWYQIEALVMWDDRKKGNIRVSGAIDDGASRPMTEDFIMSPSGHLLGEQVR